MAALVARAMNLFGGDCLLLVHAGRFDLADEDPHFGVAGTTDSGELHLGDLVGRMDGDAFAG